VGASFGVNDFQGAILSVAIYQIGISGIGGVDLGDCLGEALVHLIPPSLIIC
jgi:hypothetical protein